MFTVGPHNSDDHCVDDQIHNHDYFVEDILTLTHVICYRMDCQPISLAVFSIVAVRFSQVSSFDIFRRNTSLASQVLEKFVNIKDREDETQKASDLLKTKIADVS